MYFHEGWTARRAKRCEGVNLGIRKGCYVLLHATRFRNAIKVAFFAL